MKQYFGIKAKYPDAMLLFRVGDFYETFGEDAVKASKILGIVLTARNNGGSNLELAGFPHHSLETYLPKLVRAGLRVAICDQLEDPKATKKIVKRGVTELVTPGVAYNDQVLEQKENNFLGALHVLKDGYGVSFIDVSTGEFYLSQGNNHYIKKLLRSFKPNELLINEGIESSTFEEFTQGISTFKIPDWVFQHDYAYDNLTRHFKTKNLKGFGIEGQDFGLIAAGAIFYYLDQTRHDRLSHINSIQRIDEGSYVWMDQFTIRNLELFGSPHQDATTLIDIIDKTSTSMGGRKLRKWLALPLKSKTSIENRLNAVEYFYQEADLLDEITEHLSKVGDLERLVSKISIQKIGPREFLQLKNSLKACLPIKDLANSAECKEIKALAKRIDSCSDAIKKIEEQIQPEAPALLNKGNVFREGVSEELDELRSILTSSKDFILGIQQRESEKTGIGSLKIGFNNVFGYYLEVTNAHKSKVPSEWIRKQTLVNAERYITEELKVYESKILGAEDKMMEIETRLYQELITYVSGFIYQIQNNAQIIGEIDCYCGFAAIAKTNNYTKPKINQKGILDIKDGRHPVIEKQLPLEEEYVSNDLYLDNNTQQIIMITGPNMSGKSAILRQTALISIMAQIGSFVPAREAELSVVDKIFTRVGASDNISLGESTFMVEMNETASILNNLSKDSLILLDEIGRGTSTYDGISIAWAIAEYVHEHPSKPKTLFATHYHELNEMTDSFPRIKNFNVSVKELENRILFLRKLVPGGSAHSFGIHVAQMAGVPERVVQRANQILTEMEGKESTSSKQIKNTKSKPKRKETTKLEGDMQLSFFQLDDPVLSQVRDEIQNIDVNSLTPVEALMKLNEIQKLIG
ncbi:MAG: DNA mismatch repair protein MutS [Flavobacteriales bacterium]|nr:DNA mismatch repair protein MutS [Flavobacteriales bacterium]